MKATAIQFKRSVGTHPRRQAGVTLIELMVAIGISVIAVAGMLLLMANTLSTGSQTIEQTRIAQDMRAALQIMSREARRANYHASFLRCYGNPDCLTDLSFTGVVKEISITDNGSSDCFWFWYDRPDTSGTAVTGETVAAFRRVERDIDYFGTTIEDVGLIQMTTTQTGAPNCNAAQDNAAWVDITNPDFLDVTAFDVVDEGYTETIGTTDVQSVERVRIVMQGRPNQGTTNQLFRDASGPGGTTRRVTHFIQVRNNILSAVASP